MFNPITVPPKLLLRALDDLNTLADAARRMPELEYQLETIVREVREDLVAVRAAVEPIVPRLDALAAELAPIEQIPAMREAVTPLEAELVAVSAKLDGLREEMAPIGHLPRMLAAVAPLGGKMEDLKGATNDLEPMLADVAGAVRELNPKLDALRAEIAPVGDVVDNLPKFMKN